MMSAHENKTGAVELPREASAFRVGLHVTSLTWRGKVAWRFGLSPFQGVLRPLASFLMPSGTQSRSRTEWSSQCPVIRGPVATNGAYGSWKAEPEFLPIPRQQAPVARLAGFRLPRHPVPLPGETGSARRKLLRELSFAYAPLSTGLLAPGRSSESSLSP